MTKQEFELKYFNIALNSLKNKIYQCYTENKIEFIDNLKSFFDSYFKHICKLQENNNIDIKYVNIFLMYTSYKSDALEFMVKTYSKQGCLFEDSIYTDYIKSTCISKCLKEVHIELIDFVIEEKLQNIVSKAYIDMIILRTIKPVFRYFISKFKYLYKDVFDINEITKINRDEDFFITIGEYFDWSKTIFGLRSEIDLFNFDESKGANFRNHNAFYYKNKSFDSVDFKHSMFRDCTFENCEIINCNWNDCLFENCKFNNVSINESSFLGVLFNNCILNNNRFYKLNLNGKNSTTDKITELYRNSKFLECDIISCVFEKCDLTNTKLTNCITPNITINDSEISMSSFEKNLQKENV